MSDLKVGDSVVYRPHPDARPEDGVVTSTNTAPGTVFVRYRGDSSAKLTLVRMLERVTISG